MMKRVLLVRHAECEMNLAIAGYVGGRSNESPLTALGQRQAAALGKHYAAVSRCTSVGPVFASTAVRARETAAILLSALKLDGTHPCTLREDLLELDQGEWQGKRRSECYTPETQAVIAADPWRFAAPGGESQRDVEVRVTRAIMQHVLPAVEAGGPPALVVSHGLAIKCFLRGLLGSQPHMTRHMATLNTSVTEVGYVESDEECPWRILRVNDASHLLLEGVEAAAS